MLSRSTQDERETYLGETSENRSAKIGQSFPRLLFRSIRLSARLLNASFKDVIRVFHIMRDFHSSQSTLDGAVCRFPVACNAQIVDGDDFRLSHTNLAVALDWLDGNDLDIASGQFSEFSVEPGCNKQSEELWLPRHDKQSAHGFVLLVFPEKSQKGPCSEYQGTHSANSRSCSQLVVWWKLLENLWLSE